MKPVASCCSVHHIAGCWSRRDRQRHRTGARSSTVPSPASLMIDGLDRGTMLPMTRRRRSLWFAQSHQLGSRYRHGQRHIRRSLITNQGETWAPIKSPSLLRRVSQLGARDARVSPRESLRPKQQLFAILSLLLQDMESGLGQFVGDDVVADHLSPTAPMPFQLSFVIAAHLWIAAHRVHSCLRERGFEIVIPLLAGAPAPRDVARLRDTGHHPAVGTENFHVGEARQARLLHTE